MMKRLFLILFCLFWMNPANAQMDREFVDLSFDLGACVAGCDRVFFDKSQLFPPQVVNSHAVFEKGQVIGIWGTGGTATVIFEMDDGRLHTNWTPSGGTIISIWGTGGTASNPDLVAIWGTGGTALDPGNATGIWGTGGTAFSRETEPRLSMFYSVITGSLDVTVDITDARLTPHSP